MKNINFLYPVVLFSLLLFFSCEQAENPTQNLRRQDIAPAKAMLAGNKEFDQYWYRGEAELNSYTLEQARYGEIHQGEAVLVFVTEPFSLSKQVKLDNPSANPKDEVSVMKLNLTKKFFTGVYPYSIMQSSFTPIHLENFPNTLKVTTSSQEWCGHTFTQFNLNSKGYKVQQHSYFESEGDLETELNKAMLEDEIWARIRINPSSLPTGKFDIIPGSVYMRLRHTGIGVEKVQGSLSTSSENKDWLTYELKYSESNRTLSIHFSKSFPHVIQGWEDSYQSGFGPGAKSLTTKARIKKTMVLDYWNRNGVTDAKYREMLKME